MPLKHATETLLVFLLGVILALTGLVMATVPALPGGALPWAVLFVLAVIYPLMLRPLFQRRRADNAFRALHWFPALMLLAWLAVSLAALFYPSTEKFMEWYTWGWSLPAVTVGFILLISFCLTVIRRRVPRLALLFIAFLPFAVGAVASVDGAHWEQELAAELWQGDFWRLEIAERFLPKRPMTIAQVGSSASSEKNLQPSQDPAEEEWRERLRAMKERREELALQRLAAERGELAQNELDDSEEVVEQEVSSKGQSFSSKPSKLPTSGGPFEILGFMALAGYMGTLHVRMKKRG